MQKYKIKDNKGNEWFFVDRAFKSAYDEVQEFIDRNEGKGTYKIYRKQTSIIGDIWVLDETVYYNGDYIKEN